MSSPFQTIIESHLGRILIYNSTYQRKLSDLVEYYNYNPSGIPSYLGNQGWGVRTYEQVLSLQLNFFNNQAHAPYTSTSTT